jgi:hypothetical protein
VDTKNRRLLLYKVPAMLWLAVFAVGGCHPDVPHPVATDSDQYCRKCHSGSGRAGAPGAHDKSGCTSCHDTTTRDVYPALMPHRGGSQADCILCHEDGTIGAPITPHIQEANCYTCHEAADYGSWPPAVPHQVTLLDDQVCLSCHIDSKHPERQSCHTCHKS